MRLLLPIAILILAALSGYTGLPCPQAMCLSADNDLDLDQTASEKAPQDHQDQPFLRRNHSETFILEDPNGDRDEDGVMNLLDLYPDDPDQWFQMISDDDSSPSESSRMPHSQDP